MKRLFVYPQYRGTGIGKHLVAEILNRAKTDGYHEMVLDTLEPMISAIAIYQQYGFSECEPYYDNPFPDVIYMRRAL